MKSHLLVFVCLLIIFLPTVVFGAEGGGTVISGGALGSVPKFIPLVGIPGIDANEPGLGAYINALYRLAISLAALLAVVKIVIAGAKYMLDDIVTHKEEAKQDIWGALMGLLVIIGAVVILNTINSDLTETDFLVDPVTIDNHIDQGVTNTDMSNAHSATDAYNIIKANNGDPVIAENSSSICTDPCNQYFLVDGETITGGCSTDQAATFIKDTLGGFARVETTVIGIKNVTSCAYDAKKLTAYGETVKQQIADSSCSILKLNQCKGFECSAMNAGNYLGTLAFSCEDSCHSVGGTVASLPTVFGDDLCVVPPQVVGDITVIDGAQYFGPEVLGKEHEVWEDFRIEIVNEKSINGQVRVRYIHNNVYRYQMLACADIIRTPSSIPPVCNQ